MKESKTTENTTGANSSIQSEERVLFQMLLMKEWPVVLGVLQVFILTVVQGQHQLYTNIQYSQGTIWGILQGSSTVAPRQLITLGCCCRTLLLYKGET